MSTVRDVARASGFSISSVSIVLNNAPLARYMSQRARDHIKDIARRMGYSPNQLARSLRARRTRTVGVMVFDVTDPFCTPIVRGIETSLYDVSYLSVFADAHNDYDRFERYLEMMLERRVEGLIVLANWLVVDIDLLSDLEKHRIPTVIIARQLQAGAVSSLLIDNETGGRMAMEHLFSLGHRQIAVIRGPKLVGDTAPRWRGVRLFSESMGLKLDPQLIVDLPNTFDPNEAFEAAQSLTDTLLARQPFTAVLAYDDVTALGAMRALMKAKISVPEQCSVIGFDDVGPAAFASPPLTTIRQPMAAMGAAAVEIVAQGIEAAAQKKELETVHRKFVPELVVRQSTNKPHAGAGPNF